MIIRLSLLPILLATQIDIKAVMGQIFTDVPRFYRKKADKIL